MAHRDVAAGSVNPAAGSIAPAPDPETRTRLRHALGILLAARRRDERGSGGRGDNVDPTGR